MKLNKQQNEHINVHFYVIACQNYIGCFDDTKLVKWYHGIKEFVCGQASRNVKLQFLVCTPLMPWHILEGANINFAFMELKGWGDPGPTVALDA